MEEMRLLIENWIKEAGQLVKRRMAEGIAVAHKTSLSDLVTNVDKEVEGLFKDFIAQHYPKHQVLGEEGVGKQADKSSGYIWIIDPIDGTLNFVKERANFAIMISLYINGVGALGFIYDVMADRLYVAQKGQGAWCNGQKLPVVSDLSLAESIFSVSAHIFVQDKVKCQEALTQLLAIRMIGSSSQSSIRIFDNKYNGYMSLRVHPWDYMTPLVFAQELGVKATNLEGKPLPLFQDTSLLLATPKAHAKMLALIAEANKKK